MAKLLDGPDEEDPIIIITADEGPYLCYEVDCVDGSPETYGIRLGTLRAYYLPGLDYQVPADDSGVNIFRMILREYFGADLPDLPNRSYGWPDPKHDMYDLQGRHRRAAAAGRRLRRPPLARRAPSSAARQRAAQAPGPDEDQHQRHRREHRQLAEDVGDPGTTEGQLTQAHRWPRHAASAARCVVMGSLEQLGRHHGPTDGTEDHARHDADGAGLVGVAGEDSDDHGRAGADQGEETTTSVRARAGCPRSRRTAVTRRPR